MRGADGVNSGESVNLYLQVSFRGESTIHCYIAVDHGAVVVKTVSARSLAPASAGVELEGDMKAFDAGNIYIVVLAGAFLISAVAAILVRRSNGK
ncbi:hypothetical protein LMIY3S_03731 [Labrys miyagiensis]